MTYQEQYGVHLQTAEAALTAAQAVFHREAEVAKAAHYSLAAGGKRVRAVLCLAVCEMLNGNAAAAASYAAAIEMLHCYSLIHDDLPCMDNDDFRRGKPSCHKAFGEATALLAGDALVTATFEVLAGAPGTAQQNLLAVRTLARAAGTHGMIYGQELDLYHENSPANEAQLREIHRNKTGMLINAAAQMGAVAANASPQERQAIEAYAFTLGLVFQIVDDVLDVTVTQEILGKPTHSDEDSGKTTFVTLFGTDCSMEMAHEMTQQACESLSQHFGDRAVFLVRLAQSLLARKN